MEIVNTISYKCSICGHLYSEEQRCIECERKHAKPKEITKAEWRNGLAQSEKYPEFVEILMEDGKTLKYRFYLQ